MKLKRVKDPIYAYEGFYKGLVGDTEFNHDIDDNNFFVQQGINARIKFEREADKMTMEDHFAVITQMTKIESEYTKMKKINEIDINKDKDFLEKLEERNTITVDVE